MMPICTVGLFWKTNLDSVDLVGASDQKSPIVQFDKTQTQVSRATVLQSPSPSIADHTTVS